MPVDYRLSQEAQQYKLIWHATLCHWVTLREDFTTNNQKILIDNATPTSILWIGRRGVRASRNCQMPKTLLGACTTLEGAMNHQSQFCAAVSNKDLVDDLADLRLHGIDAPSLTHKHQFRYDGIASAVQATNGLFCNV